MSVRLSPGLRELVLLKEHQQRCSSSTPPPEGHTALIHGDVKSSNILLDRHLVAKLADFGLAQFASHSKSGQSVAQTASVGKTATIRGTLAYLPVEYVRNRKLGTAVDVYSFGVVLLEILTGCRALEIDRKSGERFLKDLVDEIEDSRTGSFAEAWRKQLDHRLITGGAAEPVGCMEVVDLACKCLDKNRKQRPAMTEVFNKLQDIHVIMRRTSSSSSPLLHHSPHLHLQPASLSVPRPPRPQDSSVKALSSQLSKLGPLEDTYQPSQLSSSFCSLTSPHPLHSSSSLPPPSSSSFTSPCETDESRGFSQYELCSQIRSKRASSTSLTPSTRDQYHNPTGPTESQLKQPSVPTEEQYNFPPQPSSISDRSGARAGAGALTVAPPEPDTKGQTTAGLCGVPECHSPVGSLQSSSPKPSVHMNPSKQRFLQKKTLYEEGGIETRELLSSEDLYGGRSCARGPEESDELDYLPAKHN